MNTSYMNPQSTLSMKPLAACLALALALSGLVINPAVAATLGVGNCNDSGSGSLRDTIASARSGDTIDMTALTCSAITLTTGALTVNANDLTLQGPGASKLTIVGDGVAADPTVVRHSGSGTIRVDSLHIADTASTFSYGPSASCIDSSGSVDLDKAAVTSCHGGGIRATTGFSASYSTISNNFQVGASTDYGNVSIRNSTISGNQGLGCVGLALGAYVIAGAGTVLISNSTISGNHSAYFNAAGCINSPNASVTIANSTVAFNVDVPGGLSAPDSFGGLSIFAARTVTLESSIFAKNTNGDLSVSSGPAITGHNNVIMTTRGNGVVLVVPAVPADTISADPQLLPLANNGGPTLTHALAAGSPAIDAGNNNAGLLADQRRAPYMRVAGARADIGAFEVQSATPASVNIGPGFTGSWYDPNQRGHGLVIEVIDGTRLLAYWFTFNPEGTQQAWFLGDGNYSGNTATITGVDQPAGGRWIPNFDPNRIVHQPWGSLTLTFTDCGHGRVDFASTVAGYGSNHMDLTRLTLPAGLTCP